MDAAETEKKPPNLNERNEVVPDPKGTRQLERDLNLGVKEDPSPAPGMPKAQGGGLDTEVGSTPKDVDPDA